MSGMDLEKEVRPHIGGIRNVGKVPEREQEQGLFSREWHLVTAICTWCSGSVARTQPGRHWHSSARGPHLGP